MVMSTCCFCREPGLGSQDPQINSKLSRLYDVFCPLQTLFSHDFQTNMKANTDTHKMNDKRI